MTKFDFVNKELEASMKRMVENMIRAARKMGIGVTNSLISSIKAHVRGEIAELHFNNSGRFSDMGVGRGVTLSQVKALGRKPKRFYSKTAYGEISMLVYNLSNKFVEETVASMQELDGLQIKV